MTNRKVLPKEATRSDAAIDGLFSGILAGVVMAVYLVLAGLALGEAPLTILARFAPEVGSSPFVGVLLHLAVSGIYGLLFGLGWHMLPTRVRGYLPTWLGGLIYGLLLTIIARTILLPGTASPLEEIPLVHLGLAHLFYGLTLGLLLNQRAQSG